MTTGRAIGSTSTAMRHDRCVAKRAYDRMAGVYDAVFGAVLDQGRIAAIGQLPLHGGESVLEVGVGTGLTLTRYPRSCRITAIDVSDGMLEVAARRARIPACAPVRLLHMDAGDMRFADESFDIVSAAYVMTTVQDPSRVLREMTRVCRTDGLIVILNHFISRNRLLAGIERLLAPLTAGVGFRTDLSLETLLCETTLETISICKVNRPPLWTLLTCRKLPFSEMRELPGSALALQQAWSTSSI